MTMPEGHISERAYILIHGDQVLKRLNGKLDKRKIFYVKYFFFSYIVIQNHFSTLGDPAIT